MKERRVTQAIIRLKLLLATRAAGLKLNDLAIRLRINPSTMTNYTNGRTIPRPELQDAISRMLNCDRSWLWSDAPIEIPRYQEAA